MNPIKVNLLVELPESRLRDFLQLIRDFEQGDPENIHFACLAQSQFPTEKMLEIMRSIDPPLPEEYFFGKPETN